jgi:hypothetical protein
MILYHFFGRDRDIDIISSKRGGGAEMVRHCHSEIVRMCAQLEIVRHFLSIGNS